MKKGFVFYESWWVAIKNLPRDVQGDVLTAIMEYGLYGETTEQLKPIAKAMLTLVKQQIDVNNQRLKNGGKGGRPKQKENQTETEIKPNNNQTITKNEKAKTKPEPTNNNIYKETISNDIVEKEKSFSPQSSARESGKKGDMDELKDLFNDTFAGKLQAIRSITPSRERAVRARIAQYGAKAVSKVFGLILDSPFLLGDNDRNWRADFDWIFKQQNFTKILEGNYERKQRTPDSGSGDTAAARRKREAEAVFARLCAEDG